jgi:hypothetical protein
LRPCRHVGFLRMEQMRGDAQYQGCQEVSHLRGF